MRRLAVIAAAALAALLALAPTAGAARLAGPKLANAKPIPHVKYPGVQRLHYRVGPIPIIPGQNSIDFTSQRGNPGLPLPKVPGYITRFRPDLVYATKDGKEGAIPRVDVIHLHHGVWLTPSGPTFAAGEEKTIFQAPRGYGFRYDPQQRWVLNYMLHNLTPNASSVFITYDIDFVPDGTAAAQGLTPVKPWWMDVSGLSIYPVFDALKGRGANGRFTFPDQARTPPEKKAIGAAHEQVATSARTLVNTAGHLHPGGLWTDLKATRRDRTRRIFRSEAKYFEPAGAVSWDVAMTATKHDWKVALQPGDRLNVSATYDTRRASWYESMGIMVVWYAEGIRPGAKDPFSERIDTRGPVTHGHLAENDNHGGQQAILPDARRMLDGPPATRATIRNFFYGTGDLNQGQRPPVVEAGQSLTFESSADASKAIYHTITGCKAPCNRETGIAYPLANGPTFDSGELGLGGPPTANRVTWETPKTMRPGTYTYFCRIHPFMRGAFRVKR